MIILYALIPLSIILLGAIVWSFFWAVKNDQFENLEQHALSIFDEEVDSINTDQAKEKFSACSSDKSNNV